MRNRHRHPVLLALSFAAVAFAAAVAAGSQSRRPATAPAQEPSRTFGERIEVRVVNLEAVVVDKEGRRVTGLGPADFRLRVDGRDVPIGFFSEIEGGRAVEAGEAPAAAGKPVGTAPPAGVEPGQAVETSFLVFIDDYLTFRPSDRNLVLDRLRDALQHLAPGDRMAMVSFNGRDLDLLANWTGSRAELERAIETEKARSPRGLQTQALVRDGDQNQRAERPEGPRAGTEDPIGGAGPGGLTDEAGLPLDLCSRIRRYEERLHRVVAGATATLRSFARPPGRRVMLLLSGGWPQSARDFLGGAELGPAAAGRCHEEGPRLYQPIYATANLLGYTLYPVGLEGPTAGGLSAATGGRDVTFENPSVRGAGFGVESDTIDAEFQRRATLERLAAETGGRALVGSGRLTAFESVVDDTRSYYWIGFTPKWQGDDEEHNVKLELTRPGFEVRSREGFQDLSRSTEVSFMVESALLFGDLPGALPLKVSLGPPGKGNRPRVPVEVDIPMDAVTMIPEGDHFVAELELRLAVLDESGDQNEIAVIPVRLAGPKPPPGSHAVYETAVKLRREPHDVVISLYDPLSDTLMVAKREFRP
jgi:VWFA-related protein